MHPFKQQRSDWHAFGRSAGKRQPASNLFSDTCILICTQTNQRVVDRTATKMKRGGRRASSKDILLKRPLKHLTESEKQKEESSFGPKNHTNN
ncbi:hypothetical protein IF2G_03402 [Cordyceps javanica]|nr:hypothetical protein IF2G_03402 [Cordyceps javanica]